MSEIDVTKCERCIGKDKFCRYFKNNCNDISNNRCIWKNFFKLKAENEDLKKKLKYAEKEYYILAEEYAEFGCFNFSEEEKQIKYPEIIKEELCVE